ncbi:MAG: acyltransferase family protein [Anaerolineales bacterium]|nr:acyltransferase family protein [Anaerolineales bacterium]MCB8952797.1 acyltransferase family protein [Ardenticatenales bacterium]
MQSENMATVAPATVTDHRRHDVDWLRTLALALLIVYHVTVSFQPWGVYVGFPQNEQPLEGLWLVMMMLNVWRIPIVFVISGMGVRFALARRNWQDLLQDRTIRILVPFVFCVFCIAPISAYFFQKYYEQEIAYTPNAGHLWFLGNIFVYVLLLLPLLTYLKNRPHNALFRFLSRLFSHAGGIVVLVLPLVLEAALTRPDSFVTYQWGFSPDGLYVPAHGFWLGLVCFFIGFLIISVQDAFWPAAEKMRWVVLIAAFLLFLMRLFVFTFWLEMEVGWLVAVESMLWMLAFLGFGAHYLNKPSPRLRYFSAAVYPVYIVHLPTQFVLAYFLLPLSLPAFPKWILLNAGTFAISLLLYEILRRIKLVRPLFGMKARYA